MKRKVKFNEQSNGGPSGDTANRNVTEPNATKKTRILIVEDEPAMVAGLRDNFEYEGYDVISAADGAEGLDRALADNPDLVVLDVMMPRMSGLDVCKQLKAKRPSLPIIMLTARGQEIDKVVGLELGADDYVTKPFSIRELMARVKAVLRRVSPQAPAAEVYRFSDVEVNIRSNEVRRAGQPRRSFSERVRVAGLLRIQSRGNAQPRSASGRGVGLRELSEHAHGRHAYRPSQAKAGTKPRGAAFHNYRSWQWL